jgi:hypothetical protein
MAYTTTTFAGQISLKAVATAFGDGGGSNMSLADYYDQMPGAAASNKGLSAMFGNAVICRITSDESNLNLFTACSSPSAEKSVLCIIESGVTLSSTSTSTPGFDTGTGWHVNTAIGVINEGHILGRGGAGGKGAHSVIDQGFFGGAAGGAGGTALYLRHDAEVTNANGYVFGGGGGGGGGGTWSICSYGNYTIAGGGGGAGGSGTGSAGAAGRTACGWNTSADPSYDCSTQPGAGTAGTATAAGSVGAGGKVYYNQCCGCLNPETSVAGDGGAGGGPGAAGTVGDPWQSGSKFADEYVPGAGGAAGNAATKNGYTLTWISGNDVDHVKGAQAA